MPLKIVTLTAILCAAPAQSVASPYRGFDVSAMDRSVRPGDDFYRFANGSWVDHAVIPTNKTNVGLISDLFDRVNSQIEGLVEQIASGGARDESEAKIGRFYRAFMDTRRLDRLGVAPLRPELLRVRSTSSRQALARLAGSAPKSFAATPFSMSIDPDGKDPTRYVVNIDQSGIGLPDRDYYLKPEFASEREAYQNYVARMLRLVRWPDSRASARAVLRFETAVAQASWTDEQRRDANATYKPIRVSALVRFAPGFDWNAFLTGADLSAERTVVLNAGSAVPAIARVWRSTPIPVLKAWEAFHIVDSAAPYLSGAFDHARFDFRGTVLTGQAKEASRSRRGIDMLNARVGDMLGRAYVRRYFSPEAKEAVVAMAAELKAAFRKRLQEVDWLQSKTRRAALEKLDKLTIKVGYPDKWRSYRGLVISSDDLFGDVLRARAFNWSYRVHRLGGPVDHSEWLVPPQSVSAYSNPQFNEIAFPAAKLQVPYFDPKADDATNYGAIGAVIGHEMTHGFDDQGRAFDSEGRLRDWWTAADSAAFQEKARRLADQYSSMEPLPGVHIRGAATLGENIADLGGVLIALDAYRASHKSAPNKLIDGFNGEQRVLLGWARIWRSKWRPEALENQIETDEHAPFEARVNGVVPNVDAWYGLFGVTSSDKLYVPVEKRVRIW